MIIDANSCLGFCVNNNKQVGIATATYLVDSNEYLPSGTNSISFDDLLANYDGRDLTQAEINVNGLPPEYHSVLYTCPGSTVTSEDYALRSYGINGGGDFSREEGNGVSWAGGSRNISEVIPNTFLMTGRSLTDGWNRLGAAANSISERRQHKPEPNFSNIDWTPHGNKFKLVYLFIDGSSRVMTWSSAFERKYWFYNE